MDRGAVFGFFFVFTVLIVAILLAGNIFIYVSVSSFLVTVLGAIGAMIIAKKGETIRNFPILLRKFIFKEDIDYKKNVVTMISFSEKARREGLLSLEDDVEVMDNLFFRNAVRLVIDGTDPEVVKQILSKEIDAIRDRHGENVDMIRFLETVSPAFGLIGTLIGLVGVLSSIGGDISVLGAQMSLALLTTLYGVIMANIIWGPMVKKLERKTEEEVFDKFLIIEGILSLQFGDNPRILEQKLLSFFPIMQRNSFKSDDQEKAKN